MTEQQIKTSIGKIAVLNDMLEKELNSINLINIIGDNYSLSLLMRLRDSCAKVTRLFDKGFGIKAEQMGEIYDAIDEVITEKITYD